MHISPYEKGNIFNVNPTRDRRLLMHKREIRKLYGVVEAAGCFFDSPEPVPEEWPG